MDVNNLYNCYKPLGFESKTYEVTCYNPIGRRNPNGWDDYLIKRLDGSEEDRYLKDCSPERLQDIWDHLHGKEAA